MVDVLVRFKAAKPLVVLTMDDNVESAAAFVVLGTVASDEDDVSSLLVDLENAAAAGGEVGVSGSAPPTIPFSSASSVLVDLSAVEHFITGLTLLLLLLDATGGLAR